MKVINYNEYGTVICRWFSNEFFRNIEIKDADLLDILTGLMVSTKEFRYGPHPTPETLVTIRKTISEAIKLGLPIPVLIPWGGRKTVPNSLIDVAEVSAINQINILNRNIKKYFSPGLDVNIRIEDTGAYWIYRDQKSTEEAVNKYSEDFTTLVEIMRDDKFISPIRESALMPTKAYFSKSAYYSKLLFSVITKQLAYPDVMTEGIKEFKELRAAGWVGNIPSEQRDYYLSRYRALYPDLPQERYIEMVADYFGGAKARYDLGGRATPDSEVGSFIQLTFVPPIPHAPVSLFSNSVYWRTVPASEGRTHIAPWRAKGYFRINNDEITCKVVSFSDPVVKELIPSVTTVKEGRRSLDISTDYIIEE